MSIATATDNAVTVTRRPRYTDGTDLTYDDFWIVVNGNAIGGTEWIADGAYASWGPRPADDRADRSFPTREAAEQVRVDALIAADRDILRIRVTADAPYRVTDGSGQTSTRPGRIVQAYLDDAARCGAVVTGTTVAFTVNHTADCHASRACEHDDQVVTYRPQQTGEPDLNLNPADSADDTDIPLTRTYEDALTQAQTVGAAHADDAGLMALFCENNLQILVGAVAPQLVWEGAQRKGMTALQLARLAGKDPIAVGKLMWV
ncbi:hypothetical protein [Actinacidiphila oryziradicis]|uniref:Uncharacterized protein n=1 Tax=Actinacidiphila oryziradicis TaxID=2571141 RepID=A0A4U0RNK3_9ACTN|nr:hypothetical protein [Actinacidiphila oryziradicis]TJZ97445.1 hypothetical protein FCI23_49655 [Actinacidiphila oryziradicis]